MPSYPAPQTPLRPPLALYRPGLVAQRFAIGAAFVVTVASVASAVLAFPAADGVTMDEGSETPAVIAYYDSFLIYLLAQIVAYVVTCAWLHLARRNAEVLNPTYRHRHSLGWVWGSWLVPIVSLWFPYQVVADVRGATSPPGRSGPWLLRAWWAAWLLFGIASNFTSTVFPVAGASDETWASWQAPIQSLAALFGVAALAAWILTVREISRTQAHAADAQGWSPALALGGPATTSYPGPQSPYAGPPSPYTGPSPPYAEPPSPYAEPPSPYPGPAAPYLEPLSPYAAPAPPPPYAGPPPPYAGWPGPGSPGGPSGPTGWWARPASSAMGVWALVLAILPLCFTWLVAIGLAVAVLLRPDDGWRRGRGLAISALVISGVWILLFTGLFVVASTLPEPEAESTASSKNDSDREPGGKTFSGDVMFNALEVGDCLPKVPTGTVFAVKVSPCGDPHKAEVYAVYDMDDGPYPGDKQMDRLADGGCWKRFKSFVGLGYNQSHLEFSFLSSTREAWRSHSRTVICMVYGNAPTTGTLRGSRR
jgi:hypothetical protein